MKLPTIATFAQIRQLLTDLGSRDVDMVDASDLRTFDTSTVALLLEAHRRARQRGVKLEIRGAPLKLHQLVALYGVHELLATNDAVVQQKMKEVGA